MEKTSFFLFINSPIIKTRLLTLILDLSSLKVTSFIDKRFEVTGQASPNSLRHAELVSASHDLAILQQVQDDDSTIIELDLLRFERLENKQDETFKILLTRIDAVNARLDALYRELFKRDAA